MGLQRVGHDRGTEQHRWTAVSVSAVTCSYLGFLVLQGCKASLPLQPDTWKLLDVWNGDFASIDPEEYAVGNFTTFYNDFTSQFATSGSVLNNYVAHQETMVNGYDDQRQQTAGVSSDEELENFYDCIAHITNNTPDSKYYVVESSEPYADRVQELMKEKKPVHAGNRTLEELKNRGTVSEDGVTELSRVSTVETSQVFA